MNIKPLLPAALLMVSGCSYLPPTKYQKLVPEWFVDTVVMTRVIMERKELERKCFELNGEMGQTGCARMDTSKTPLECTIYVMQPKTVYGRKVAIQGHEAGHCFEGRNHKGTYTY